MAVFAQWDEFDFEVSSEAVRSFESISTGMKLEYERNGDTEGQEATQTVRRGLQTISLKYKALAHLNVKPKDDLTKWFDAISKGTHAPFYIAGENFYGEDFLVKSVDMDSETVDTAGNIVFAEFSVEFEEYCEEPSGLKIDKGVETSFTPGIQDYEQSERDQYLRDTASKEDRLRLAKKGAL